MSIVLNMKIATQPYWNMRVKYARKRPPVGSRVYVKPADRPHAKWEPVYIDKYNDDGYCFATWM